MAAPHICHHCLRPVESSYPRRTVHPACQRDAARRKRLAARRKSNPNPPTKADLDDKAIALIIDRHMGTFGYAGARLRALQAHTEVRA